MPVQNTNTNINTNINTNLNTSFGNNTQLNASNADIKVKLDTLIDTIQSKTALINSLQTRMKDTAVTTRKIINSKDDIRGKNIFLAQPIEVGNILDYLAPLGIEEYLSQDFKPIVGEEPLSITTIEAAIYTAANQARTNVSDNVYISMGSETPLSLITSNRGGFYAGTSIPNIYSSTSKIPTSNMQVLDYTYYELTDATWNVNGNNNLNFIGIGHNGMIYTGTLEPDDLTTSIAATGKTNNPNVHQPLIGKYINNGSLPVNQPLVSMLSFNREIQTDVLNIHTNAIASIKDMIQTFKNEKADFAAQKAQAEALVNSAKANIAKTQKKLKSDASAASSVMSGLSFFNFFSKVEEFIRDEKKVNDDIQKIEEDTRTIITSKEEEVEDQAYINSDNAAIAYLGVILKELKAGQALTQNMINDIKSSIHTAENPPPKMSLQNFNTKNTTPTQNSQHAPEFSSGYTHPIEYLGCYRDGGDRAIANFHNDLDYYQCAAKAVEEGDNIFGLQYGGSAGRTPQCFTDLQSGPDYTAATKHPGSTSEIQHSTEASFVQPKVYTCVSDTNNPSIKYGGAWTNATYLVQAGYATRLKLIGLSDQTSDFPAGSLVMDLKNAHTPSGASISGFPKLLKKAPANTFISATHLVPFPSAERGYYPNTEINSSSVFQNFIGSDGDLQRSLYSADFMFKLSASGTKPPNISICINTNVSANASANNVAEKRAAFVPIQAFISDFLHLNPGRVFNSIYYLDLDVNNFNLGSLGFINYDNGNSDGLGTSSNPYKVTFYNNGGSGVLNPSQSQDEQFEFLKLRGSLKPTANLTLQKPDDILDINECKQYCYGNVSNCTAWQFNELDTTDTNKCLITSQTNLNDILMSSAWSSAKGSETEFNIRMPTRQAVPSGCPPFSKANVVVARIPIIVNNSSPPIYSTTAINTGTGQEFYYTIDTSGKEPSCNVTKELGTDLSTLESLKADRQVSIAELDSLLSNMNSVEQEMYTQLLQNQTDLNTNVGEYNTLRTNLGLLDNESDISMTMTASVDDSMMQLIDNSYEYILWTILAIVVVIIAINLAKK